MTKVRLRRTAAGGPFVLWWVPAGHIPSVDEAEERLNFLRSQGPTPIAFTFQRRFSAPISESVVDDNDDWFCPA